ncbi:MAG: hypothetical protein JWM64_54 [Frankiales bacterium]|nr:hypothetical protein [Frankiales bacterium]
MAITASVPRKVLAAIRLTNGALGLLAPELLLRRLGTDPRVDRSGVYPFRMFGIRTVLLAGDLVLLRGAELQRARRLAVLVHATDTVSAAVAWRCGDLPPRAGRMATAISAVNLALAVGAQRE